MGAVEVVGVDVDDMYAAAKAQAICQNFEVLGLTSEGLSLSCGDVQALAAAEVVGEDQYYHAVISDLPYGIKETTRIATSQLLHSLLQLANKVLLPGGRCVFFYPYWTPTPAASFSPPSAGVLEFVAKDGVHSTVPLPSSLALLAFRRQQFSPHFSRVLVVLEKLPSEQNYLSDSKGGGGGNLNEPDERPVH